jgi:hypothetical protein
MSSENLARWKAYMAAPDHAALWGMLHADAVFESPVVHTPQQGRAIVCKYLAGADQVLGGANFHYTREWCAADSAIIEFETIIDGITVNGIDMITWDAAGLITHFKVMVRPLKAMQIVHARMAAMLAAMPG